MVSNSFVFMYLRVRTAKQNIKEWCRFANCRNNRETIPHVRCAFFYGQMTAGSCSGEKKFDAVPYVSGEQDDLYTAMLGSQLKLRWKPCSVLSLPSAE